MATSVFAQLPLDEATVEILAAEVSGESAKRNLEQLSRHHRMRGSAGYRAAADHIVAQLKSYGVVDARIESLKADGNIFYGPQRSRRPWNAEFAELWEIGSDGSKVRHANWDAMPLTLAQDSESADVTAYLVDVGNGTAESDYEGRDVKGRLVLAASQPGPVAKLAMEKFGAAGIVSYAQNQRTGWWKQNEDLIRWGHLDTFARTKAFAFMVSLGQARRFQDRLASGELVRLHAIVRAGQNPGDYEVVTGTIPGGDPSLRNEEIVFSCHLDHPRPGANDNASGCSAILEVARTLSKLIREDRIARPARTIRFVWPPEIEGTHAFLNGRPAIASRIKAAIHLDMVGGGPETKAINHITRGPASLPSFIYDVAESFGVFVNEQSEDFAKTQSAAIPFLAPEGGREPFRAEMVPLTLGSDHEVYTDSSFGIPAIYLNQWPDRYIHTNFDTPANIDSTVLKRFAFIAAASGYFVANVGPNDAEKIASILEEGAMKRTASMLANQRGLDTVEAANLRRFHLAYERRLVESMSRFFVVPETVLERSFGFLDDLEALIGEEAPLDDDSPAGGVIYARNPNLKGPLATFGYDYLEDHAGRTKVAALRLTSYEGQRGGGGDYTYEALNLVDGSRSVSQIRDDLSAIYGPVPVAMVEEYLRLLESVGVVKRRE